ncbi:MAG: cell division protein FtsW, partial [Pseudomonadota bacterium]
MNPIARTDRSLVGQWFWTVDHWLIMAILLLMVTGAVLTSAASPPAAMRIGQEDFYFVKRHFVFLPITVAMVVGLSLLKRPQVTAFC